MQRFSAPVVVAVVALAVAGCAGGPGEATWISGVTSVSLVTEGGGDTVKAVTVATTCGTCAAVATPAALTLEVAGGARTCSDDLSCACRAAVAPFADHLVPVVGVAQNLAFRWRRPVIPGAPASRAPRRRCQTARASARRPARS